MWVDLLSVDDEEGLRANWMSLPFSRLTFMATSQQAGGGFRFPLRTTRAATW